LQIVVAIMPCLETQPLSDNLPSSVSTLVPPQQQREKDAEIAGLAANVLTELIVVNRKRLGSKLEELPVLPSIPALVDVNRVLAKARGELGMLDHLRQVIDGLRHESLSVRCAVLGEFRHLMRVQRAELNGLVALGGDDVERLLGLLVAGLLKGCSEEARTQLSNKLKMLCAECLGELGALDPARLIQVEVRQPSKMERTDEDLAFELVTEHLAKMLRAAADTEVQDAAALAIQEILKFAECRPVAESAAEESEGGQRSGERLWARFPEGVREIVMPCLTSRYVLKRKDLALPPGPLFRHNMVFRR
jgi:serine/threonine-protein kinase ATR